MQLKFCFGLYQDIFIQNERQKQSWRCCVNRVFCVLSVKTHRKTLVLETFLIKMQTLRPASRNFMTESFLLEKPGLSFIFPKVLLHCQTLHYNCKLQLEVNKTFKMCLRISCSGLYQDIFTKKGADFYTVT